MLGDSTSAISLGSVLTIGLATSSALQVPAHRGEIAVGGDNVQAHVAHIGAARAAAQALAQSNIEIARHRRMPIFGALHGEHFAADVFMAIELRRLPSQVVGCGEKRFLCVLSHGDVSGHKSMADFAIAPYPGIFRKAVQP